MPKVTSIVEGTFILILVYLVLSNAFGFSSAMSAIGSLYTDSVKTLQGR